MKNRIAVIMCVYKGDTLSFLKETLLSLYQQTFNNFDIHIQCDGKLPTVLDEYLESELLSKRIFLLNRRDANVGFPASLNELLKNALNMDYEYFVRMDADDICDDCRIEKQFLFMERSDNIDVVGSDILEFYDDGSQKLIHYRSKHEQIKSDFSTRTAIPHVTAFFRRSFFDKAGLSCNISRLILRGKSSESTTPLTKRKYAGRRPSQFSVIKIFLTYNFTFDLRSGLNKSNGGVDGIYRRLVYAITPSTRL